MIVCWIFALIEKPQWIGRDGAKGNITNLTPYGGVPRGRPGDPGFEAGREVRVAAILTHRLEMENAWDGLFSAPGGL